MNETKSALESLGVWGGLIAIGVPSVLEALGQGLCIGITPEVANIGANIVAAIGGALAIWGRVRATKRIA